MNKRNTNSLKGIKPSTDMIKLTAEATWLLLLTRTGLSLTTGEQ